MNETNEDVCMYIEEFILVDVVTLLYMDEVKNIGKNWFIYTRNKGMRYVRIALRSQLTSED